MDMQNYQVIKEILEDELNKSTGQIIHWEHQQKLPLHWRVIGEEINEEIIGALRKYRLSIEKALKALKDDLKTNLQPSPENRGSI